MILIPESGRSVAKSQGHLGNAGLSLASKSPRRSSLLEQFLPRAWFAGAVDAAISSILHWDTVADITWISLAFGYPNLWHHVVS